MSLSAIGAIVVMIGIFLAVGAIVDFTSKHVNQYSNGGCIIIFIVMIVSMLLLTSLATSIFH